MGLMPLDSTSSGLLRASAALLLVLALSGCASAPPHRPVPEDRLDQAVVPGMGGLRFWGDARPENMDALAAERIAHGCGDKGPCADYLRRTVESLAEHRIHDRNLWRLQALVARALARP